MVDVVVTRQRKKLRPLSSLPFKSPSFHCRRHTVWIVTLLLSIYYLVSTLWAFWCSSFYVSLWQQARDTLDYNRARIALRPETRQYVYVISLQNSSLDKASQKKNRHRLDRFISDWEAVCHSNPNVVIRHCPGILDPIQGRGISASIANCLQAAYKDDSFFPLFFEDDTRMFNEDFCYRQKQASILSNMPRDAMVVLLGGHQFQYENDPRKVSIRSGQTIQYEALTFGYGAYAYIVPRWNLLSLSRALRRNLKLSPRQRVDPDLEWYKYAKKINLRIYKTRPLYFMHPAGYSNTWNSTIPAILGNGPPNRLVFGVTVSTVGQSTLDTVLSEMLATTIKLKKGDDDVLVPKKLSDATDIRENARQRIRYMELQAEESRGLTFHVHPRHVNFVSSYILLRPTVRLVFVTCSCNDVGSQILPTIKHAESLPNIAEASKYCQDRNDELSRLQKVYPSNVYLVDADVLSTHYQQRNAAAMKAIEEFVRTYS